MDLKFRRPRGLPGTLEAMLGTAVFVAFALLWTDFLVLDRADSGAARIESPFWIVFTPLPTALCLAILLSGVQHSLRQGRRELGRLRVTAFGLTLLAGFFSYGPGAWIGPSTLLSWVLVIVASARQYAWLRNLERDAH